jgi:hypothetical protein
MPRCCTNGVARTVAPRQLRQKIITCKRWSLGRELLVRATLLTRQRHRLAKLAFDRIPAGKQLGDVLVRDLGLELGVRDELWSRETILKGQRAEEHQVADHPDRHDRPAALWGGLLTFRKPFSPPRATRRPVRQWCGGRIVRSIRGSGLNLSH